MHRTERLCPVWTAGRYPPTGDFPPQYPDVYITRAICSGPAMALEAIVFGAKEETQIIVKKPVELGRYVNIQLPDEIPDKWFDAAQVITIHRLGRQIFVGCVEREARPPLIVNCRGESTYEYETW